MVLPGTKTLIVGANGLIGEELMTFLPNNNIPVIGTTRSLKQLSGYTSLVYDLNEDLDKKIDLSNIDWCILCAAETSIKECEKNQNNSSNINVARTINLIDRCIESSVKVLFFSSDCVFDGTKAFYTLSDQTCPITEYGKYKLEVEKYINLYCKDFSCVIRLTKVISNKTPIIKKWKKDLAKGKKISAFTNKLLSPLPIQNLCDLVLTIIKRDLNGTFQLGGIKEVSYYDFAKEYFGKNTEILPTETDEPKRHASLEAFLPTYEI